MLPTPIILLISAVGLILLSVIAYISTGSFMSVIVILTLAIVIFIVLQQLGVLVINTKTTDDSADVTVDFYEKGPAPAPPSVEVIPAKVIAPKEVFYVSGNDYTYDDAAAVCAAYNLPFYMCRYSVFFRPNGTYYQIDTIIPLNYVIPVHI